MQFIRNINIISEEALTIADAICFTANGIVKRDGKLIMGAGNAKQFRDRFVGLDLLAGQAVKKNSNMCQVIDTIDFNGQVKSIIAFPTKHRPQDNSDIELIKKSACELMELVEQNDWKLVILPAPGIGHGRLNWEDVEKALHEIFDDRVAISFWLLNRR